MWSKEQIIKLINEDIEKFIKEDYTEIIHEVFDKAYIKGLIDMAQMSGVITLEQEKQLKERLNNENN